MRVILDREATQEVEQVSDDVWAQLSKKFVVHGLRHHKKTIGISSYCSRSIARLFSTQVEDITCMNCKMSSSYTRQMATQDKWRKNG